MSTFSLCFPHIPHSRMVMMSLRLKQLQSLVYFYEYHSKHIFSILSMILPSKTIPDSAKRHKNPTRCGGTYLPCGTKFLRVLIFPFFAVFPAIRKNKFPQIKITANIFPAKIYSRVHENAVHENAVLRNRVCSITTSLFHSETKWHTMKYWFIV